MLRFSVPQRGQRIVDCVDAVIGLVAEASVSPQLLQNRAFGGFTVPQPGQGVDM
ncbi:MAG: hypothetical protein BroJett039_06800 [Chloroflexota bacterium]|nr:MAG: hypothetical protein BroJett039_06800 [Chloroflexota bacterium]